MDWIGPFLAGAGERFPWALVVLIASVWLRTIYTFYRGLISGQIVTGERHTERVADLQRQLAEQRAEYLRQIDAAAARLATAARERDWALQLVFQSTAAARVAGDVAAQSLAALPSAPDSNPAGGGL